MTVVAMTAVVQLPFPAMMNASRCHEQLKMRFLNCDVPECTSCGECRIKAFAKGDALGLRLAGYWMEKKRLCVCLIFYGKVLELHKFLVLQLLTVCAV